MPLLKWSDELSTGINSIDDQHKRLLNMINTLNDAFVDGKANECLSDIIDGLNEYTVQHFGYEESLFEQYGYGESEAHKQEHIALINQLNDLKIKMLEGDFLISIEVMAFLKSWLINHIMKSDKAYAPFLIDKGVS